MAENKITHAGVLKLPEPEWLTLEALAERWGRMTGQALSAKDVEAYAAEGLAIHDRAVFERLKCLAYKQTPPPHEYAVYMADLARFEAKFMDSQEAAPDSVPEKTSKTFTAPDGTKGEKQEAAVLYWIAHKNWNPLEVPDGEKGTIKDMCERGEETGQLFRASTAFAETWRRLRKNEIVRMASHDSYAHRGN